MIQFPFPQIIQMPQLSPARSHRIQHRRPAHHQIRTRRRHAAKRQGAALRHATAAADAHVVGQHGAVEMCVVSCPTTQSPNRTQSPRPKHRRAHLAVRADGGAEAEHAVLAEPHLEPHLDGVLLVDVEHQRKGPALHDVGLYARVRLSVHNAHRVLLLRAERRRVHAVAIDLAADLALEELATDARVSKLSSNSIKTATVRPRRAVQKSWRCSRRNTK